MTTWTCNFSLRQPPISNFQSIAILDMYCKHTQVIFLLDCSQLPFKVNENPKKFAVNVCVVMVVTVLSITAPTLCPCCQPNDYVGPCQRSQQLCGQYFSLVNNYEDTRFLWISLWKQNFRKLFWPVYVFIWVQVEFFHQKTDKNRVTLSL